VARLAVPMAARCTKVSAASSYSNTTPPSSPRQLDRARHDRGEDGLEIERRRHRLPDLAQRGELADRSLSSVVRACSSVNKRTFSMAITAWLANVSSSSISRA
jgi:hypothetical protein